MEKSSNILSSDPSLCPSDQFILFSMTYVDFQVVAIANFSGDNHPIERQSVESVDSRHRLWKASNPRIGQRDSMDDWKPVDSCEDKIHFDHEPRS